MTDLNTTMSQVGFKQDSGVPMTANLEQTETPKPEAGLVENVAKLTSDLKLQADKIKTQDKLIQLGWIVIIISMAGVALTAIGLLVGVLSYKQPPQQIIVVDGN